MTRMAGGLVDIADFAHSDSSAPGTAATNFTDSGSYAVRFGPLVMVHVYVNTTNALTATTGNIGDTTMYTTSSGWRPPVTINAVSGNGLTTGECTLSTSGVVSIRAASDSVGAGSNIRQTFVWIDAPA